MSVLAQLFVEFFKTGLFAVGGGLATLPFLYDIAGRYDWISAGSLPDMLAVSESTPGPIGVNMATYAGYNAYGIVGGVVATFALVLPSVIVILLIARFLEEYDRNPLVKSIFKSLRPAVTGLIAAAGWQIVRISLFRGDLWTITGQPLDLLNLPAIGLFAVIVFAVLKWKWHPLVYIAGAAAIGVALKF